MSRVAAFLRLLAQSRISLLGAVLVTTAVLGDVMVILGETLVFESNPYIGLVTWVAFPAVAVLGLVMIPIGAVLTARKRGARNLRDGVEVLRVRDHRSVIQVVLGLTMMNLVLFSLVGYRSFGIMHSRQFCGEVCHQPMHAEYNLAQHSPHSELDCVECHVGSGIGPFIKSKLDGTRQLIGVITGDYSRPIPTPLHNLRPASEVCEVCHYPSNVQGDRIRVTQDFASDEGNTRTYTVLNLRVGAGEAPGREAHGIHWHTSKQHVIRYHATDPRRENIVRVELEREDGTTRVWTRDGAEDVDPAALDEHSMREMDCVDCHNRPTHVYLPPDVALDDLLARGAIDPEIPWIRRLSEELVTREYSSNEEAFAGIDTLASIYEERFPEHWEANREKLPAVADELKALFERYVHPEMNIRWNTYPSLIGHPTSATSACFRCHDGLMRDGLGETIVSDCETCHFILADKEKNPLVLRMLEDR